MSGFQTVAIQIWVIKCDSVRVLVYVIFNFLILSSMLNSVKPVNSNCAVKIAEKCEFVISP